MELVKILSNVVKENVKPKMRLTEVSNKVMNQLITKFKSESDDTEEEMKSLINAFDRFKNGLGANDRDITKYSYDQLRNLVKSKNLKKEELNF